MNDSAEIGAGRQEYRLKTSRKLTHLAYASMLMIGAGFFFKLAINPFGRDFALVVGFLLLISSLILVRLAFRSRLILDGSRIELRSVFRTFAADRSQIEGLRKITNQYGSWTRICIKDHCGAFDISDSFTGNHDLTRWLKGLPDLDRRDADEIKHEIDRSEPLGSAPNESLKKLKKAKIWAIGLSVGAGVITVPVLFLSYKPVYTASLAILAAAPMLGIALIHRFPLLFTIFKRKTDPRADIGYLLIWPGIGIPLSYQNGNDAAHLVNGLQLAYWFLLVLVCFGAALFKTAWQNPSRWGVLAGILIFGGLYSVALVNTADTVPDRSAPVSFRVEVLKKYETHGKNASSYLRLAPWGPMAYTDDVAVSTRLYRQTNVGDQVCAGLHPGFLHAPWYSLTPCRDDLSSPSPQAQ